jgi:hypothetical protein
MTKKPLTAQDCDQSVETLQEYKRKGIPVMPHQEEFLKQYYAKFRKQEVDA